MTAETILIWLGIIDLVIFSLLISGIIVILIWEWFWKKWVIKRKFHKFIQKYSVEWKNHLDEIWYEENKACRKCNTFPHELNKGLCSNCRKVLEDEK